jgi:hypothetical protein
MKKILFTIIICIVTTFVTFSQRQFSSDQFCVETVDEFGDKTGDIKTGFIAEGYFSNSATTNSCAMLMLSTYPYNGLEMFWTLYEYCGNHASNDSFRAVFTGTTTKEVISEKFCLRSINAFLKLCEQNDTINVKMYEVGDYATTTAVFRLFNCKSFKNLYINTALNNPNNL